MFKTGYTGGCGDCQRFGTSVCLRRSTLGPVEVVQVFRTRVFLRRDTLGRVEIVQFWGDLRVFKMGYTGTSGDCPVLGGLACV